MTAADLHLELRRLEESLYAVETRFDPDYMRRILADDFFEFGRSGNVWNRDQIIDTPRSTIAVRLPLPDFRVRMISPEVALVSYRTEVLGGRQRANRSSVWRRGDDGWELVFHQGTPAAHENRGLRS